MQIQEISRADKREIRYRRGPSLVRKVHSVQKTGFCGTRRIFRGTRCAEQASVVQKGYSVPETPSYGTGCIFRAAQNTYTNRFSTKLRKTHSICNTVRKLFDIAACGLNPLAQFRQSPLVNYRINSHICQKCC